MFCYVLFDFDGVLIDSVSDLTDAVNHTLTAYGYPLHTEQRIATFIGNGAENLLKQSFGITGSESLPVGVMVHYRQYYLENCTKKTTLYPNVYEGLLALHTAKVKMAVVTNKPLDMTQEILLRLGINHLFEIIVAPEMVECVKPAPDALLYAMKYMQADPQQTLIVGDTWTDIVAGKNAGIATCAVLYGIGNTVELLQQNPDYVFQDFQSVCDEIRSPENASKAILKRILHEK